MNINPLAVTKNTATVVVGGIAAYQSFWHMHDLVIRAREGHGAEWIIPFSVDGMMLVATTTMIQDKRNGRKVRPSAWVALGVGMVASLAANVASADPNALSRIISAWPAVALTLVIELVSRKGRKVAGPVDTSVLSDAEISDAQLTEVAKPRKGRPVAETMAMANHIWATNPTLTRADVASRLGISDGRLAEVMRMTAKV